MSDAEDDAVSPVYVLLARLSAEGIELFQRYETRVLALLPDYGGRLERRLRSADGLTEIHLVSFPSPGAFEAYREDQRRVETSHLLTQSGAHVELFELYDVP